MKLILFLLFVRSMKSKVCNQSSILPRLQEIKRVKNSSVPLIISLLLSILTSFSYYRIRDHLDIRKTEQHLKMYCECYIVNGYDARRHLAIPSTNKCHQSTTRKFATMNGIDGNTSDRSYIVHTDDGLDSSTYQKVVLDSSNLNQVPELEGPDPPFLENCETCHNTGFVICTTCKGQGHLKNPRSVNVFYCPDCVGHKKLRCPTCGGKCYMCE